MNDFSSTGLRVLRTLSSPAAFVAIASLAACGGGDGTSPSAGTGALASDTATLDVLPVYRLAPVAFADPDDRDADGLEASGQAAPAAASVSLAAAGLSTAQAVPDELKGRLAALGNGNTNGRVSALGTDVRAEASTSTVATVYTPAQIRAAYGLAQLPAQTVGNKGAYQGSGQTIYIVDAYHNPNIANDLAVFNQKFGLATCGTLAIGASAPLPLAASVAGSGCSFGVAYAARGSTTSAPVGALSSTAPAINKSWVTEISLDVEWAHAIAPLARIILIEAQSSTVPDLMAAVALANKMGPGIVSMSFGVTEFAYASMQFWGAPLGGSGLSYVAATGDSGSAANWPAVDARVLAVSGTTLSWNGATRAETAWSSTGGATSRQVPVPSYQAAIQKPGDPATGPLYRGSSDVAFNANPYSGQYIYVTPSSTTGGAGWISAGGTSLSAPQWAGLLAIGNASRALAGKSVLGQAQALLYGKVYGVAGNYAAGFVDVTSGSNGTCGAMCNTASGYDLPTGLGSPNAYHLVGLLSTY